MRTASDILADLGVRLRSTHPGNQKALCPQCSHRRKKKREPCLSVSIDGKGVRFQCHNADCGWHGGRFYDDQSASGRAASGQGDRCREPASRIEIFTAGRGPDGEPRPDPAGNILILRYIEGGSEVNAKYRTLGEK